MSGRLQIYRVKNIGSVVELSGVAFRLVPPDGGLLAKQTCWIRANRMNLFLFGSKRFA